MKFILTAGGTGGHIYPALSVLDEIKKDKNNEYLYIGTKDRMESDLIPSMGIPYEGLEIYGLSKTNIIRDIKNIKCINIIAAPQGIELIQKEFPEIEEFNFDDIDLNIDFDLDSIEFPEIDFDFSFLDEEEEQQ